MLKTRIITAILLVIGFLMALFFTSSFTWSLITLFITVIAVWEWMKLIKLNAKQITISLTGTLIIGLMLVTFSKFSSETILELYADKLVLLLLAVSAVFWVVVAPTWLITRKKINQKLFMSILGISLLLATWIALIGLHKISPLLLLSVLATVWIADSAAYFAGKKFGKHKLAPEISPGKTWEGVMGALFAVTLYGLLLCHFQHLSRWLILGLWLIVILSVMGDLFESLLKRQSNVKDSSQLLPGHGGVLDRIDGLIPTLPLVLLSIYFPLFTNLQLHG
ncbi:MAG: phosphatidate cytidylyltransferase [Methylotenera sp.]|jgi:phosphatidate cytidylyltransferase|nr:phosphatidate cytidylyltransferase [Methylotenera sp.]HPH08082.1 phosphatidate cytidylyltransferase [Methylotenera sp.]HPM49482.1 phosphatidate cytidylyltransferase [Methylotenera sp.]HQM87672.1 phosphatidate cytidylyltransferase [Methylotenera sp.]